MTGCKPLAHRAALRRACRVLVAVALAAPVAQAQFVQPPVRRDTVVTDTIRKPAQRRLPSTIPDSLLRPPITPKAAFLRSALLPGWGQSGLRRNTAATLFSTVEIGAIYMVAKSRADLRSARALDGLDSITVGDPLLGETLTRVPRMATGLVNARRLHLEDWVAALLFNHLLAGADAYVAANLWDLPARVSIRHTPTQTSLGAQFRW